MTNDYRNIDGTGNNPLGGTAGEDFIRENSSDSYDYADGLDSPGGQARPSAREISNEIASQTGDVFNTSGVSDFFWLWGQFVDHDIDLTAGASGIDFNIEVPQGDLHFDPFNTGLEEIDLERSGASPGTGTGMVPREQINEITAFLDGSVVYGSDSIRQAELRDTGGYLKTSAGDLLPFNTPELENAPSDSPSLFLAGDVRANENAGLTSMHTVFVREHNRLVDELKSQNPGWDDEMLYQEAKLINEAQIQSITYNDFLPLLVGENALSEYSGYDSNINPQIANIFATAAYRFGHTMLSSNLNRVEENGETSTGGHLALRDAFFNPSLFGDTDIINDVFRGLATHDAQMIDTQVIDDVRNFLFGPPGAGGFDLVSLNIQRGRDHGLPDYNTARELYGLDKVTSFSEITTDTDLAAKLEALYGNVDNIDVWVGGLSEETFEDSMMGELFTTVIIDQFERVRDGDQYWYETRFEPDWVEKIESTKLSDIIERNTDITHIQDNVFLTYDREGGTQWNDDLYGTQAKDLLIGFSGHDKLYGKGGNDQLHGDKGNDYLYGNKGNDTLYGGKGHDELDGGRGHDKLYGENGHDWLFGGYGNDHLDGGRGNDYLSGDQGHDTLHGGQGKDDLYGGKGHDTLYGDGGKDNLYGENGNDTLHGGEGNDHLYGGYGQDHLYGGKGNDHLNGGLYNDVFHFEQGDGKDSIHDFQLGHGYGGDKIDLSGFATDFESLNMTTKNGHTVINMGNNDKIIVKNVEHTELIEDYFIF